MEKIKKLKNHITLSKYLFSVIMILLIFMNGHRKRYLVVQGAELLLIFFATNLLLKKNQIVGYVSNLLLLILYNAQLTVCLFASRYLYLIMLENTDSVEALSGRSALYVTVLGIGILVAFLPVRVITIRFRQEWMMLLLLCVELLIALLYGNEYSPIFAYVDLALDKRDQVRAQEQAKELTEEEKAAFNFYHSAVDGRREPDEWVEEKGQPNVILIFTEGLSQNIVKDEREIMPTVACYEQVSLNFEGMFNHTAATYRGLIGQLYSSFQRNNPDLNTLPSLQSILREQGYHTAFINPEPENPEFTAFTAAFGFQDFYGSDVEERLGNAISLSDRQMYTKLMETAEDLHEKDEPFFIAMYTFGTHISFASVDEKYPGEDSTDLLDRFYDADYQFGEFMINFLNSEIKRDTLIIFTADHATNEDYYFRQVFPPEKYRRYNVFCDEVPFFIFYDGIRPETIQCGGRTSINLTPTILDYLNVTAPNYFLGSTLFGPGEDVPAVETTYHGDTVYSTRGQIVQSYSKKEEDELQLYLNAYCDLQVKWAEENPL